MRVYQLNAGWNRFKCPSSYLSFESSSAKGPQKARQTSRNCTCTSVQFVGERGSCMATDDLRCIADSGDSVCK